MPDALTQLNNATATEFAVTLGDIFEHAPWVAEAVAAQRPFATVTALHQAMLAVLAAAGIPITLHLLSKSGRSTLIAETISNTDGRSDGHLIHDRPVPIGTYELRFALGAYFAERGIASFLDMVPIRFTTTEPEAHYHIPLLFSPWSYTTYRGS